MELAFGYCRMCYVESRRGGRAGFSVAWEGYNYK